MGRLVCAAMVGLLATDALSSQTRERATPPGPTFRGSVDLVTLNVTVTDREQRYVASLDQGDFTILEDDRPQTVSFFARSGIPMTVVLAIDTSGSMDEALGTAQDAAATFVRRLGAGDRAAVVDFDTRVKVVQPFTTDARALEEAVRSTVADGSTALFDAVHTALTELESLSYPGTDTPRRHAIVVLSDGQDTSSRQQLDAILALADRSNTVIYTVGLGAHEEGGRLATYAAEFALRRMANQTGGRAFFPMDIQQLHGIYDEIRRDLASQYTISYASNNRQRDGRWRNITIRVQQHGLDARTRPGYFASRYRAPTAHEE
jgi:Ca-activated chloride channel family protein